MEAFIVGYISECTEVRARITATGAKWPTSREVTNNLEGEAYAQGSVTYKLWPG